MIGILEKIHVGFGYATITIKTKDVESARLIADKLTGADCDISIKKHRNKRSNEANAYCWELCSKIADVLKITKEDVYMTAVRDMNVYRDIPLREDTIKTFAHAWQQNGIAWFCEIVDDYGIEGFKLVRAYYGSSSYNTKQMSRLIDWLVFEAKAQGIEVLSDSELALLKERHYEEHNQQR